MKWLRLWGLERLPLLLVSDVQILAMLYFGPEHRPQGSLVWAERQARSYRLLKFNFSSEALSDLKVRSQSVSALPYPLLYSADDVHQEKIAVGFPKGLSALQRHIQVLQCNLKSLGSLTLPFWDFNTFAPSGISNIHKQQMTSVAQEARWNGYFLLSRSRINYFCQQCEAVWKEVIVQTRKKLFGTKWILVNFKAD